MENISFELIDIVFSLAAFALTILAKKYVDDKRIQGIIVDAISYAEEKGAEMAKNGIVRSFDKKQYAIQYLEKVDPKTVEKIGDKLETLLKAKVAQVVGAGATGDRVIK